MRRAVIICKVRGATREQIEKQRVCVESLERCGYKVHWPHRNTAQKDPKRGTEICQATFWAIFWAHEIHVIYDPSSEGFVADLMLVFALNELSKWDPFAKILRKKKVIIVNPDAVDQKIEQEIAEQVAKGVDPQFVKSYTMVLRNLAEETANL